MDPVPKVYSHPLEFFDGLTLLESGKVREIFAMTEDYLLLITTDRISAYDVIMKNEVNDKGAILTSMSAFWFEYFKWQLPDLRTHLVKVGLPDLVSDIVSKDDLLEYGPRSMVVQRCDVIPIESIVRGYITGSAWSSYCKDGTVHGIKLPEGLQESQELDKPMWTPSTKAKKGAQDENISPAEARELIGTGIANEIEKLSLQIYALASSYAASRGIIIADTKFEFGLDKSVDPPRIMLIDEVLTPDSSRFWDAKSYKVGRSQASYDKQYLRDWLTESGLKGQYGVEMPPEVVENTYRRYKDAYHLLTGRAWHSPKESNRTLMFMSREPTVRIWKSNDLIQYSSKGSDESVKPNANAASGVSAASARALGSRLVAFYFRAPVKAFFRTRVDYLAFARATNPRVKAKEAWSWRMTSPALLAHAVRAYGWGFIPNQVLPPLLANVSAGAVLYSTYLRFLDNLHPPAATTARHQLLPPPLQSTFIAGSVAGAVHSSIITPLEALQRSFQAKDIIEGKHKNMWLYGFSKSRELGFRRLYAGWSLCLVKETISCALFFATFEVIKSQGYRHFTIYYYGQEKNLSTSSSSTAALIKRPDTLKPHYALEPAFLMLAGIAASVAQQVVQHPLERVQDTFYKALESVQEKRSSNHDASRLAYQKTLERSVTHARRVNGWRRSLFRGFLWNTIKQTPSTSAGLIIFELVRKRYDIGVMDES